MTKETYIARWLWLGIALVVLMILVGGTTRLTGSGLSMVEWKPITGIIPPLNEQAWLDEFNKYKLYPEFQKINSSMTLEQFKQIYFWEYLHRLLGRVTGIAFLIPFIIFYVKGWLSSRLLKWLMVTLFVGASQGAMGWYMVKSGLDRVPHVSHFRLAAHQGLAFLLIGLLYWLTLSPALTISKVKTSVIFRMVSIALFFSFAIQCTLGAFVAGLKAGFSYTNFPWMDNSFFPSSWLWQAAPFLSNGVAIQFVHRWLGVLIALGTSTLYFMTFPVVSPAVFKTVKLLVVTVWLQAALGACTLLFRVPVALGVVHQATAILLVLLFVRLTFIQFQNDK